MRNLFFKGFAAITMGLTMTACMQEFDYEEQEQQASLNNAQQTLGFYIPDNQDWVMSGMVTANVPVNVKDGEVYTVKVYSNDPLMDGVGYVLATGTVNNGQNFTTTFRAPSYKHVYFFGLTNSEGETIYRSANMEDGELKEFNEDKEIVYDEEPSASRTRSVTVNGDTYSEFNFPTQSELSVAFPTAIPAGCIEVSSITAVWDTWSNDNNKNFQITSAGSFEIGGGYYNNDVNKIKNIYVNVDGEVAIHINGLDYVNIYILKGDVSLSSNAEYGGMISVASEASLTWAKNSIAHNGSIKLFNRGAINFTNDNIDLGNNCTVYNEGSVEAKKLSYSPGSGNTSYFINMGDDAVLNASSMTMNSTCHFYTDGTTTITGETKVTQAGIVWINNGHYTTGSLVFSAHNGSFYNYCQLVVTGQTNFIDGAFHMMDNSYAEFNTAVFNNFHVTMGNNSGVNIKGGSKWGRQGSGIMQGFYAKDDNTKCYVRLAGETLVPAYTGYAFNVQGANLILAYNSMRFFKGKIQIDLNSSYDNLNYSNETTAEQLAANQDGDKTWNTHNVTKFVTGDDFANVKVEKKAGQCAATWTVPGEPSIVEENNTWTYAFEDNKTRCDFDLNDVVIQVRESETDDTKLIVKLVAAGCEYDNYVWLGNTPIVWAGGAEVHDAFGVTHGVMVNTGNNKGVDKTPVEVTIDKPTKNFDFQNADFKIRPYKINSDPTIETNAVNGDITIVKEGDTENELPHAPLGIAIPAKWKWPKERVVVSDAYTGFTAWGKQEDLTLRAGLGGWYETPVSGQVYGE